MASAVGKLLWVRGQTRPDISFEVCQLATNIKNSDESSMKNVNKLFSNESICSDSEFHALSLSVCLSVCLSVSLY